MKILLFADTHIDRFREYDRDGSRLENCLGAIDSIADYVDNHREIKAAVFLGDMFHRKSFIDVAVFNAAYEAVKRINVEFTFMIPGNHDIANKAGEHALETFHDENTIVAHPNEPICDDVLDGRSCLFLPFTEDVELYASWIDKYVKPDTFVFTHIGIDGAKTGVGEYTPRHLYKNTDFGNTVKVFSGHYHTHQVLGNFTYIGSTMEHRHGEMPSAHGFGVLDTKTGDLQMFELGYPRFIKVTADKSLNALAISGNYVKGMYRNKEEKTWLDDILREHAAAYVLQPVIEEKVTTNRVATIKAGLVDTDLIKAYVEHSKMNKKAQLIELGIELLKESR